MNSIDIVKMLVPLIMQIINKSTKLKLQTIDIEFNDIETIIHIVSYINRFSECKTIKIIMNELNPSY